MCVPAHGPPGPRGFAASIARILRKRHDLGVPRVRHDTDPPRPEGLGRGPAVALALLFAALGWLYVAHPPGGFTRGGQIHGDGVYHYAITRSLVLDRDLDLANDYALLGNPHHHGLGPAGRVENRVTVGTGVLWIPSFLVAHAVVRGATAAGWIEDPGDGTSRLQQRITLFGSVVLGLGAVVLGVRLAARYASTAIATTAGIAIALASPLCWYMVYQPSWPHAANAFVVTAFVWVWHEGRATPTWRGAAALGALGGLMMLVRPQNVLFFVLPGFDLVRAGVGAARAGARAPRGAVAIRLVALAGAAALCFGPQMWAWASVYGDPLVIPQGPTFMRWGHSKWVEALFSSRNGLFAWTPLVGLSIACLVLMSLRRPAARSTGGLLLAAFVLQAYVNGSADDWWGGWAFGGRRFVGCTGLFILGTAYGLHVIRRLLVERAPAAAAMALGALVLVFASYNASFMWDYWHAQLERGRSQPLEPATRRWASRLVGAWYAVLGHPGALPVNLVHAMRAGVSPGRYDATSGWELATDRGQPRGWDRLSLPDPRFTGAGFGPARSVAGRRAAWVEDEAVLVLPVRYATDLELALLLRPARPQLTVRVEVGGHVVMDRALVPGWAWYRATVPTEALAAGLNYLHITQSRPAPGPRPPRPIGATGQHTPVEIEVISDPEAAVPLRFALGRTTIDIARPGITAFAIEASPSPDAPGYRPLGTFDITGDVHAAGRLARTIEGLAPGQPVALGLARSTLVEPSAAVDEVIASLGGRVRLRPSPERPGYALIGARGAAPGTAREAIGTRGPARARVGRPAAERHEGAAWAELTVWRSHRPVPEVLAGQTLRPAR